MACFYNKIKIFSFIIGIFLSCLFPQFLFAAVLLPGYASDLISDSGPSIGVNHTIQFQVTQPIPPSGEIIITPEDGEFLIPLSFDIFDIDFSVAPALGALYTDRSLANTASPAEEGVVIQSGFSGSLVFTLNSSAGLSAGNMVRIELGTNAAYGGDGVNRLVNPDTVRSYKILIETSDASDAVIDSGGTMIAIVEPVAVGPIDTTDRTPPVISNGAPTGLLPGGTRAVELSVETDEFSYCRYATTTGVDFTAMTGVFPTKTRIGATPAYSHYDVIARNLLDSTTYSFYVRCRDYQMNKNLEDYVLSFKVGIVPNPNAGTGLGTGSGTGSGTGVGSGSGGGSGNLIGGGSSGSGPGGEGEPGGGNFLKTADVSISGTAYPSAKVSILLDGKEKTSVFPGPDGKFTVTITGLERGTYTFGLYAIDAKGVRSAMISSTVSLIADTMNTVAGIIFPPTIQAEKKTVDPGKDFVFSGSAMPKSAVEVALRDTANGEYFATSTVDARGGWSVTMSTVDLSVGSYTAQARSSFTETETSGWSISIPLGIGQEAAPELSLRADLNKDGKVNLVDFSILLFSWGTSNGTADINMDGKVNLSDFSIMIFYWTG